MEKIWFAEYQKRGIPETVELPAENTSLVDIFERNFQKFGSRDAFIFMDKVLTYNELEVAPSIMFSMSKAFAFTFVGS